MPMLREVGEPTTFSYLASLGLDPEDVGRLAVASGNAEAGGFYVEATSGDARLLSEGEAIPAGVWLAQSEIDGAKPGGGVDATVAGGAGHGFGEGWGTQGPQLGGDRSYPEEDSGGFERAAAERGAEGGDGSGPVATDAEATGI